MKLMLRILLVSLLCLCAFHSLHTHNQQFYKKNIECTVFCTANILTPKYGELPAMAPELFQDKSNKEKFICRCQHKTYLSNEIITTYAYFIYDKIEKSNDYEWGLACSSKQYKEKKEEMEELIKSMNRIHTHYDVELSSVQKDCKDQCKSFQKGFKKLFNQVTPSLFQLLNKDLKQNSELNNYWYACICNKKPLIGDEEKAYFIRDYGWREKSEKFEQVQKADWEKNYEKFKQEENLIS